MNNSAGRSIALIFTAVLLLIQPGTGHAQPPTDCGFAIGVCSNGSINESSNGPGIDDFAFTGNFTGCLVSREHQSVWLYVQVTGGNVLGFDIIPNVFGQDYDFAVYGPNVTCQNLGQPVRCSYAAPFGSASTGMNGSSGDLSEGASGDGYVRWLTVEPGQGYYILVDNFSASFQGFTLNWTGDGILDCSITLPCPEFDLGPNTVVCENGSIELGRPTGPSDRYLWNTGATTPVITVSDSGLYWLEVTRNGCSVRDSIYIGLAETPEIDLGSDTLLCSGTVYTLNASHPSATGYLWQDGYLSPIYNVTTSGTYSVEVFNGECVGTDAITVDFDPIPVVDLGPDTTLCNANGYALVATTSAASSYLWQDGSTSPMLEAAESGTYWVQTSNTTCTFTDSVELRFGVYPVYDLGTDRMLCEGDTLLLDAYADEGIYYLWQDGSTSTELEATASGTYTVVVSNDECAAADSIYAEFLPYPVLDLGADTTLCDGDTLLLDGASIVATDFLWLDGSDASTFTVTQAGTYGVTVQNEICAVTDSILVLYKSYPVFSLGPDTVLCRGTAYPIEIDGEQDYSYLWSDNSTGNAIVITRQDEYVLAVENQCGVRYDTVNVIFGSCNCDFFMPTGFTPNGDGLNDIYIPIYDCDSMQDFSFEVYNRWGELLFATDNADEGWPGTDLPDVFMDAFVWQMYYSWTWRGKAMTRREKGHFAIIR